MPPVTILYTVDLMNFPRYSTGQRLYWVVSSVSLPRKLFACSPVSLLKISLVCKAMGSGALQGEQTSDTGTPNGWSMVKTLL